MEWLQIFWSEIIGFLGITSALDILARGDYQAFTTYEGIVALVRPIIPFLLLIELVAGFIHKHPQLRVYRINFLIYVFNRFTGRFITIAMVTWCIGFFQPLALFQTSFTWYWLIYGYIVWEFGHFLYHYWGHKVRLFWCLHATHHVPEDMNLSVNHAHFFLEAPYADAIRSTVCLLMGIHPELLFLIMFIDGTYGSFIHLGENVLKDGRLGFLSRLILTPSHHRVHHARNPLYMDRNFCNLLNVWDRLFGTYQDEDRSIRIDYGITREMNSGNFWDVYFGEFVALFRDVYHAPGLMNKLRYVIMPPGWSHTGDHRTAKLLREEYLQSDSNP